MNRFSQPTKEQVRAYMLTRFSAATPPPDAAQIKAELGFRSTLDSAGSVKPGAQQCG